VGSWKEFFFPQRVVDFLGYKKSNRIFGEKGIGAADLGS
jgi:hypothetical protein